MSDQHATGTPAGYDPDLARMDDDGWGCAVTSTPPGRAGGTFVTVKPYTAGFNQAYVRMLLASRQPAFATALELALAITETRL